MMLPFTDSTVVTCLSKNNICGCCRSALAMHQPPQTSAVSMYQAARSMSLASGTSDVRPPVLQVLNSFVTAVVKSGDSDMDFQSGHGFIMTLEQVVYAVVLLPPCSIIPVCKLERY